MTLRPAYCGRYDHTGAITPSVIAPPSLLRPRSLFVFLGAHFCVPVLSRLVRPAGAAKLTSKSRRAGPGVRRARCERIFVGNPATRRPLGQCNTPKDATTPARAPTECALSSRSIGASKACPAFRAPRGIPAGLPFRFHCDPLPGTSGAPHLRHLQCKTLKKRQFLTIFGDFLRTSEKIW